MPSIESLLLETNSVLGEFLAAIEAERRCLSGSDVGALSGTTNRKSDLAAQLSQLESQRDAALVAKGFAAGRAGVEAWLASLAVQSSRAPRATWKSILESVKKAKRENDLNGKLIATRLQQNQQALGILLGEGNDSNTYGADGQRSAKAGRRTLGSA